MQPSEVGLFILWNFSAVQLIYPPPQLPVPSPSPSPHQIMSRGSIKHMYMIVLLPYDTTTTTTLSFVNVLCYHMILQLVTCIVTI